MRLPAIAAISVPLYGLVIDPASSARPAAFPRSPSHPTDPPPPPPPLPQVFTVEMHHKRVDKAGPGDNVGMNIKGLDKGNMPRTGDVMILKSDATLKQVKDFTAQIQTLDIPGEVKAGYSPIGFVRCGRSACRITGINWKVGGGLGVGVGGGSREQGVGQFCSSFWCFCICAGCVKNPPSYRASDLPPPPPLPSLPPRPAGGQGDRRQEAGGPPLPEGQRDGRGCV